MGVGFRQRLRETTLTNLSTPSVLWRCWLGGRKGIQPVKNMGGCGCGGSVVRMGWRPLRLPVPLPPLSPPAPQKSRRMMAYNNTDFGYHPVGAPTCLRKQEVGKPSLNAAQPYAKAEGCVHDDPPRDDKLRKGWSFRVGTWNVDSLTGELVEALVERRMDVACVQGTRWRFCV